MDLSDLLPAGGLPLVKKFPWDTAQKDIFSFCSNESANLSVEAVAGSGKTTTLLEAMNHCPGNPQLFLAFSRQIADELRAKVPPGVTASTFHSCGLGILRPELPPISNMDGRKNSKIAKANMSKAAFNDHGFDVARVLSSAKNAGFGLNDSEFTLPEIQNVCESLDVFFKEDYESAIMSSLGRMFEQSCSIENGMYDFDDMIYQPLRNKLSFPKYGTIFVDESQDLNHIQHLFLSCLVEQGARIVCVGDTHQAIYGFRGASHESMNELSDMFDTQLLPLSVSYRCATKIVDHAQRYVPHIKAADNAVPGSVTTLEEEPDLLFYAPGDMVICRNNAPLFKLGMEFLIARKECQLRTNHGKELIHFIKKFHTTTSSELKQQLSIWRTEELRKAKKKKQDSRINFIEERYDIVLPFCGEYGTPVEICNAISTLLDSKTGPILCTIHKSKGLEARRAFILRPDLLPSKYATTPEQLQQEDNLTYVAVTRALEELYFLPGETTL